MIPNTTSASTPATTRTIIDDESINILLSVELLQSSALRCPYPDIARSRHSIYPPVLLNSTTYHASNQPQLCLLLWLRRRVIVLHAPSAPPQYADRPANDYFQFQKNLFPLYSCALRYGDSCRVIDQYQYRFPPPVRPQYSTELEPEAR